MTRQIARTHSQPGGEQGNALKFLAESEVQMIDEALDAVGEFGEVRLVVQKGRLRFVVTQKSHDALRWQPGAVEGDGG